MSLRDIIGRDQVKVFGDLKGLAETIEVKDKFGGWHSVNAMVEREMLEVKEPAGYGAKVGRSCLFVWIPNAFPVMKGVSRVRVKWRQTDAEQIELAVTEIAAESESCFRLECVK